MTKSHKKIVLAVLGLLLSAGSLVFVFRDVAPGALWTAFGRIQVLPLVMSVVVYWAGLVVVRAQLVRFILGKFTQVPLLRAYRCLSIGFLANNVLPFRIGDVARSGALAAAGRVRLSTVIGGMALERMLDFFMAALVAFGAIVSVRQVPDAVRLTAVVAACVLGTAFLFLMWMMRRRRDELTGKSGLLAMAWNLWIRFSNGFSVLGNWRGVGIVLGLSALLWSFGVASIMFRLASFQLPAGLPQSLLVFACLGFGVALPSAPGYVGVYQVAVVIALSAIGVDETVAAAFGLFSWGVDIAVGNIAGVIGMVFEGMTWSELGKMARAREKNQ